MAKDEPTAAHDLLQQLESQLDGCRQAEQAVRDISSSTSPHVMVPCGEHAFYKGEVIDTGRFRVPEPGGGHRECSAAEALAYLGHRQQALEGFILTLRQAPAEAGAAGAVGGAPGLGLRNEDGDEFMEIRETEEDSDLLLRSAAAVSTPAPSSRAAPPEPSGASKALPQHGKRTGGGGGGGGSAATRAAGADKSEGVLDDPEFERLMQRMAELEVLEASVAHQAPQQAQQQQGGVPAGTAPATAAPNAPASASTPPPPSKEAPARGLKKGFFGSPPAKAATAAGAAKAVPVPVAAAPAATAGGSAPTATSASSSSRDQQPREPTGLPADKWSRGREEAFSGVVVERQPATAAAAATAAAPPAGAVSAGPPPLAAPARALGGAAHKTRTDATAATAAPDASVPTRVSKFKLLQQKQQAEGPAGSCGQSHSLYDQD